MNELICIKHLKEFLAYKDHYLFRFHRILLAPITYVNLEG